MKSFLIQGDAAAIPLVDKSVDLVFTSPPYADARTYGIGAQRSASDWIDFMLGVVTELTRVCRGLVLVNCAGVTRDRCYWPCCEGLLYEWWKRGGQCWRPAYWHRVGIPGSGGKQWLRADVEYILAFKADSTWLDWSDNTANGHPPKWGPGGEMSHRQSSGARVNQWGAVGSKKGIGAKNADGSLKPSGRPSHVEVFGVGGNGGYRADGSAKPRYFNGNNTKMIEMINRDGAEPKVAAMLESGFPPGGKLHTKSSANGEMRVQAYLPPVKANPGTLVQGIKVGGGIIGSKLAHENEAPFPEKLAEWFIKGWCKPGGIVLDPFSGSATTARVARRLGRIGIGMDLRWSQCELGTRRLAEPEKIPGAKRAKVVKPNPLQQVLFSESA
jgi:hypothetical protein